MRLDSLLTTRNINITMYVCMYAFIILHHLIASKTINNISIDRGKFVLKTIVTRFYCSKKYQSYHQFGL